MVAVGVWNSTDRGATSDNWSGQGFLRVIGSPYKENSQVPVSRSFVINRAGVELQRTPHPEASLGEGGRKPCLAHSTSIRLVYC